MQILIIYLDDNYIIAKTLEYNYLLPFGLSSHQLPFWQFACVTQKEFSILSPRDHDVYKLFPGESCTLIKPMFNPKWWFLEETPRLCFRNTFVTFPNETNASVQTVFVAPILNFSFQAIVFVYSFWYCILIVSRVVSRSSWRESE